MSKTVINFSDDRTVAYGKLQNGRTFIIDSKVWDKIKTVKIHLTRRSSIGKQYYIYRKDTSKTIIDGKLRFILLTFTKDMVNYN